MGREVSHTDGVLLLATAVVGGGGWGVLTDQHRTSVGNFSPAMGARNQVGIGLPYRPASQCILATQFQTQFLEFIPSPMTGLMFSTQTMLSES